MDKTIIDFDENGFIKYKKRSDKMKLGELYQSATKDRIQPSNMKDLENGLTITDIEIIGKKRKGVLLSFKESELKHKCNRIELYEIADKFKTQETDDFIGKKIYFKVEDEIVRVTFKNNDTKKEK